MATPRQPHMDSMGMSSCHEVNGVLDPSNFHPMRMNSGNESIPTSVASNGHFPFTTSELPGMRVDTSVLDTAFKSDVRSSVGLHLAPDNGNSRSFGQLPWNFSLSDLTADLSNL
ncbi:hypothetical protein Tco_0051544 [Tanacetum coccineum]